MILNERSADAAPAKRPVGPTAFVLWWILAIVLVVGCVALLHEVLLLFFAGLLIAVFLRALTRRLARWTGLPDPLLLALVVLAIVGLIAGGIVLAAPKVADQADALLDQAPRSWSALKAKIIQRLPDEGPLSNAPEQLENTELSQLFDILGSGVGVITTSLGGLGSAFIILILGIYLAFNPAIYRQGAVRLLPIRLRPRAAEVMVKIGKKLEGWIFGTCGSAAVVGALTFTGLWLLGIPMALILALIATALTFIPNIGPLISVLPAILVALPSGIGTTAGVIGVYLIAQTVESYLVTPMIQRHTISMPPVVILLAQIAMGILFGILGVAIAMPLAATFMTIIHEYWVKDRIEKNSSLAA